MSNKGVKKTLVQKWECSLLTRRDLLLCRSIMHNTWYVIPRLTMSLDWLRCVYNTDQSECDVCKQKFRCFTI